jgi:hypothetical protein
MNHFCVTVEIRERHVGIYYSQMTILGGATLWLCIFGLVSHRSGFSRSIPSGAKANLCKTLYAGLKACSTQFIPE